jgi:HEPN domain-containing protein
LPRKTDASNPADWLWLARSDLDVVRLASSQQVGFTACRSKLAEIVEKTMKAELIRLGWPLERIHDLERLLDELVARKSDLVPAFEPLCDALTDAYFTDRYPGFDLDDPDWPALTKHIETASKLLETISARLTGGSPKKGQSPV